MWDSERSLGHDGGECFMTISYNKLRKKLIDLQMNKTQLCEKAKISTNAMAKLGKNEPVSMETINKICVALKCNIGDIMDIVNEEEGV